MLNPSGTLVTGTLIMPASPGDQQPFEVITSQTITALTNIANQWAEPKRSFDDPWQPTAARNGFGGLTEHLVPTTLGGQPDGARQRRRLFADAHRLSCGAQAKRQAGVPQLILGIVLIALAAVIGFYGTQVAREGSVCKCFRRLPRRLAHT